jgi:hypothetical protein
VQPLPLIAALLAFAGVVGFVVAPLLRPAGPTAEPFPAASLAALERRERALAALRELEFDHRTGKVNDDDYARLLGPLRAEAAKALQAGACGEAPT